MILLGKDIMTEYKIFAYLKKYKVQELRKDDKDGKKPSNTPMEIKFQNRCQGERLKLKSKLINFAKKQKKIPKELIKFSKLPDM